MGSEPTTPAGLEVARTSIMMVLGIVVPLVVQWLDKRRLPAHQQARAWNIASWGSALYAFGPLSMLGWAWVTRPRWRRIFIGAAGTGLTLAFAAGADLGLTVAITQHAPEDAGDLGMQLFLVVASSAALLLVMELCVSILQTLRRLTRSSLRPARAIRRP